jgi:hypothetical protein
MLNRNLIFAILVLLIGSVALAMQDGGGMPEGHPQIEPQLPQGHPQIDPQRRNLPDGASAADQADVGSVDAIITAYYDTISGGKGEERDWGRFLSLFSPDARFITVRAMDGQIIPFTLTPQQFVQANASYFESGGYFEKDVNRVVERYGSVAHVFSTYETRRSPEDDPYSRGINSMQLLNAGGRWWIVTIMWDYERSDNPIPTRYLPAETTENAAE